MLEKCRHKRRYPAFYVYYPKIVFTCQDCGRYFPPDYYGFSESEGNNSKLDLFALSLKLRNVIDWGTPIGMSIPICKECSSGGYFISKPLPAIAMIAQFILEEEVIEFTGTTLVHTDFNWKEIKRIADSNPFRREGIYGLPINRCRIPSSELTNQREPATLEELVERYRYLQYSDLHSVAGL